MTPTGFKRKLSAVFMADVVGFSRLMGEDEAATLKTLSLYQEIMAGLIKQHRGRIVDAPGDAVLAEFSSVVDAVQGAVAVQKELQVRNAELPENRRMQFRIGINLGDVIEEGDKIYGDGVNIAARLEALADPGGVCISKTAFDHIESKLPLGYEFLGEKEVKNISRPVGAYRVLLEPRVTVAEEATPEKIRPGWPGKVLAVAGLALFVAAISLASWQFGWFSSRPGKQAATPEPQSPAPPLTQATPSPQNAPAAKAASLPKKSLPRQTLARPKGPSAAPKTSQKPVAPAPQEAPATQVSPPPPTPAQSQTAASPPKVQPAPAAPLTKETSPTRAAPSSRDLPEAAALPPRASRTPAAPEPATPAPSVAPPRRVAPPIQLKRFSIFFKRLDTNNDGNITVNEFMRWRQAQFRRLDANNDGSLSRLEVATGKKKFDQKLLEKFYVNDTDRDQTLSRTEFQEASRRKFLKLDANRDGNLSQTEMLNDRGSQIGRH